MNEPVLVRCAWCTQDPLYQAYHDQEWGRPLRDDRRLFEMINLEGAQAGLSWITVLRKRDRYRQVFDQFDPEKIVRYKPAKIDKLLQDPGIIRNRLKVNAVIENSRAYLKILENYPSFQQFIWRYVDDQPRINQFRSLSEIPTRTPLSIAMSKDLKKHGFRFVGDTICYAFMQAVGMVNDHTLDCWTRNTHG